MRRLVAGNCRQGPHPVLGTARLGPAIQQFERIGRRLFLQVCMIVQQRQWLLQYGRGPRVWGPARERKCVHDRRRAHCLAALCPKSRWIRLADLSLVPGEGIILERTDRDPLAASSAIRRAPKPKSSV